MNGKWWKSKLLRFLKSSFSEEKMHCNEENLEVFRPPGL